MGRVLIMATPRSGTLYVHKVLQGFGLDVGHERLRSDGGVGYNLINDYGELTRFDHIVHVVRDPRDCIASIAANFGRYSWIASHRSPAAYWFSLNDRIDWVLELARQEPDLTVDRLRIENSETALASLARLMGADPAPDFFPSIQAHETNHRKEYDPYSWDDLSQDVREMATRYGYGNGVG